MKKFVAFMGACVAASAGAQAQQSDPVLDAIQRVAARGIWQDEQYTHAYDAYVECYGKALESAPTGLNQSSAESLFRQAFNTCTDARNSGTSIAEARANALLSDKSPEYRQAMIATFRRASIVLGLEGILKTKGLDRQFRRYADGMRSSDA
jgi:hypothetical protein